MVWKWLRNLRRGKQSTSYETLHAQYAQQYPQSSDMRQTQRMAPAPPAPLVALVPYLQGIELGDPQHFEALTLFPLYKRSPAPTSYILLAEALETAHLLIEEIHEEGHVPLLQAHNKGSQPILVLDGEELVGAKQNRIANASYLLAPQTNIQLPVSCTEQGRWSYKRKRFQTGQTIFGASARQRKHRKVTENLRHTQSYQSDQAEIWQDVKSYLTQSKTMSGTTAYSDYILKRQNDFDAYTEALPCQKDQVGQMVFLHQRFLALDTLDLPAKAKQLYPRLMRSYIQEAIDPLQPQHTEAPTSPTQARALYERLWQIEAEQRDSLSLGHDLRFQDTQLMGAALVHEGRCMHLSVFPAL